MLFLFEYFTASGSSNYDNASSLMKTLFTGYEKSVIPICDDYPTVQVKIGLAVRQIIELVGPICMSFNF